MPPLSELLVGPLEFLPALLKGAWITVQLTLMGAGLAFVMAMLSGLARLSKNIILSGITSIYIEFFRGTSVLVQLFWLYYALPVLLGIDLPRFTAGVLALGLNVGAYGAEVVRGAIQSVPKGQTEASIALNMTQFQRMRRIIVPQAIPIMLPAFGNLLIELLKSTSLVSLITIPDLTYWGVSLRMTTGRTVELFAMLLVMYFLLAYPLVLGVRFMERRLRWD